MTRTNPSTGAKVGFTTCPECLGQTTPTLWMPAPGMDNLLREFECRGCHYVFYLRIAGDVMRARITTLQKDMLVELEKQKLAAKTAPPASLDTAGATAGRKPRRVRRGNGR